MPLGTEAISRIYEWQSQTVLSVVVVCLQSEYPVRTACHDTEEQSNMATKSPDKILFENWKTPEKQEREARGIFYHNLANGFSSGHCAPTKTASEKVS